MHSALFILPVTLEQQKVWQSLGTPATSKDPQRLLWRPAGLGWLRSLVAMEREQKLESFCQHFSTSTDKLGRQKVLSRCFAMGVQHPRMWSSSIRMVYLSKLSFWTFLGHGLLRQLPIF